MPHFSVKSNKLLNTSRQFVYSVQKNTFHRTNIEVAIQRCSQEKDALSKFTAERPCRSVISKTLLCNVIEITLWHGCSAVNLLHIFRTPLLKDTSGWLFLEIVKQRPFRVFWDELLRK